MKTEPGNHFRVGLIGCGYQGLWLARAVAGIDNLNLVACSDPSGEAVESVKSVAKDVQAEDSPEQLISREDIDVVFIATPHHLLHPYGLKAVEAGKHVLAEKPIGLNARQGIELERAVARNDVVYMAGYSFRYFPPVAQAKNLISDGVIGDIQTISAGMALPGVRSGWPSEAESGGGILGFYGCHMVDRVLWFLEQEPVEVYATVEYHPEYHVDQTSVFQVKFDRGALAQFNICGSSTGMFDYAHVSGKDGHIYLSMPALPRYSLTVSSNVDDRYSTPQTTVLDLDRETAILQKLTAELIDFSEAISEHRQPPITVSDGRKVLQVLDAVTLSAQTGTPVSL